MFDSKNKACRCRHIGATRFPMVILAIFMFAAGCGYRSESPVAHAKSLWQNGKFDEAIEFTAQAAAKSQDPLEQAELWKINGRTCWDMTAYTSPDREQELLQTAVKSLTKSIELVIKTNGVDKQASNADAYYVRMLTYERLGKTEEAKADGKSWRTWDVHYAGAYINEKPKEPLYTIHHDDESEEDAAADSPSPKRDQVSAFDSEDSQESPTGDSGESGQETAASGELTGNSPATERKKTATRPDRTSETQADRLATDETAETDTDDSPESEDSAPEEEAPRPRVPGSTWQPWYTGRDPAGPSTPGLGAPSTADFPSTGVVGPSWQDEYGVSGDRSEVILEPAPPSTGIAGPTLRRPDSDWNSAPSTGIGAPPAPTIQSGLPTEWNPIGPNSTGPAFQFTGALPMDARPFTPFRPTTSGLPNVVVPGLNPLRPSPLTQATSTYLGPVPDGILPQSSRMPQRSPLMPNTATLPGQPGKSPMPALPPKAKFMTPPSINQGPNTAPLKTPYSPLP